MRRLLFLGFLGIAGALIIRTFLFEGIYLKTESMSPTLDPGDHVIVNKWIYKFNKPKKGDIVMFHTPQQTDPEKGLVKRVIAVEGDTLAIKNKKVFLNGEEIDEPYVQNLYPDIKFIGDNFDPIVIPKGHVFVMGDNRDVSDDSRDWKNEAGAWSPYVSFDSLEGRVAASEK